MPPSAPALGLSSSSGRRVPDTPTDEAPESSVTDRVNLNIQRLRILASAARRPHGRQGCGQRCTLEGARARWSDVCWPRSVIGDRQRPEHIDVHGLPDPGHRLIEADEPTRRATRTAGGQAEHPPLVELALGEPCGIPSHQRLDGQRGRSLGDTSEHNRAAGRSGMDQRSGTRPAAKSLDGGVQVGVVQQRPGVQHAAYPLSATGSAPGVAMTKVGWTRLKPGLHPHRT